MVSSIENFKGIKSLENLHISNLNFFAGVNSAGKSTISQLLIPLKHSLKNEYASDILNKDALNIDSWKDKVHDEKNGKFGFTLEFDRNGMEIAASYEVGSNKLFKLRVGVIFEIEKELLIVNTFCANIIGDETEINFKCIKQSTTPGKYKISTNNRSLKLKGNRGYFVTFSSMFPLFYEELINEEPLETQIVPIAITRHIRESIQSFLKGSFILGLNEGVVLQDIRVS